MPRVLLYSTLGCKHCKAAKALLTAKSIKFHGKPCDTMQCTGVSRLLWRQFHTSEGVPAVVDVDSYPSRRKELLSVTGVASVPQIFIGERFIGGNAELQALDADGKLLELVTDPTDSTPIVHSGMTPRWLMTEEEYNAAYASTRDDSPEPGEPAAGSGAIHGEESKGVPHGTDAQNSGPSSSAQLLETAYFGIIHPDKGLASHDVRSLWKTKPACVTGAEVVVWLSRFVASQPSLAPYAPVSIAQHMLESGMIVSLDLKTPFTPDDTLYRLQHQCPADSSLRPKVAPTPLPAHDSEQYSVRTHVVSGAGACVCHAISLLLWLEPPYPTALWAVLGAGMGALVSTWLWVLFTCFDFYACVFATPAATLLPLRDSGPLNVGYIYTGPTVPALTVSEALRRHMAQMFDDYLSSDGKAVDYAGLARSTAFADYARECSKLQRVNVFALSQPERVAFFINVYNALVIHAIALHGHPTSSLSRHGFFDAVSAGC